MKKPESKNIAASANQRLLNIAKQKNESFDQILMRYGLERFLYQLGISKYKDQFLLKGSNTPPCQI